MANIIRRIKSWARFQHYQDGKRKPEWIKVYRELLNDIEWHELPGDDAKLLVNLWLLASENGGVLPPLKTIAFRLRLPEKKIESMLSRLPHWIEGSASGMLADCYQSDSLEENKKEEENKNKKDGASAPLKSGLREKNETPTIILKTILDETRAKAVVEHRQKLRKPLTRHGARLLAQALGGAPDPNVAADTMIERGWVGFKPDWLKPRDSPKTNGVDRGPDSWSAVQHEYRAKYGAEAFKVYCSERENK